MFQEGIYLIEVAEWFGYCKRCSTIEQVDNHTGTGCVVVVGNVPLHWSVFMDDTSQSYYCKGGTQVYAYSLHQ